MNKHNVYKGRILLITGEKGSGKTQFCSFLVDQLKKEGILVKGVLSPGRFMDHKKVEVFAEDISSGDQKKLAIHEPGWDPSFPKREWRMQEDTLSWGNDVILKSVPTDVLIIDELGFLEFEERKGWYSSLQAIGEGNFHYAFVVVRPQLLDLAMEQFGTMEKINIDTNTKIVPMSRYYADLIERELVR